MFYKESPWIDAASGLGARYRKGISPINNIAVSLFESVQIMLNGQELCNYPITELDYFSTLLNTPQGRYRSGDCIEQGFFKETAGFMDEWNCGVDDPENNPPKNTNNPARENLCKMFYSGGKTPLRMKLLCPLTQNHKITPVNFGNRITINFVRHKPAYYLFSGPNNAAAPNVKDLATKALDCSIRLSDFKVEIHALQLAEEYMKEYINSYTDTNPDQYIFTRHNLQTYNYSKGYKTYDIPITCDKVPDKIALTMIDSQAHVGMITKNPHIFYKLPAGAKCEFQVNGTSMYRYKVEKTRDVYRRMKDSLMPNNSDRLLTLTDLDHNDTTVNAESGYTIYADTLTFTAVDKDGSVSMDNRQAAVTFHLELPVDKDLPADKLFRLHLWDTRTFTIQPSGQLSKDFI